MGTCVPSASETAAVLQISTHWFGERYAPCRLVRRRWKHKTMMPKRMLTVQEFCTLYSVSKTTCYKLISLGHIRAFRALGRTLLPFDEAERWASTLPAVPQKKRA